MFEMLVKVVGWWIELLVLVLVVVGYSLVVMVDVLLFELLLGVSGVLFVFLFVLLCC